MTEDTLSTIVAGLQAPQKKHRETSVQEILTMSSDFIQSQEGPKCMALLSAIATLLNAVLETCESGQAASSATVKSRNEMVSSCASSLLHIVDSVLPSQMTFNGVKDVVNVVTARRSSILNMAVREKFSRVLYSILETESFLNSFSHEDCSQIMKACARLILGVPSSEMDEQLLFDGSVYRTILSQGTFHLNTEADSGRRPHISVYAALAFDSLITSTRALTKENYTIYLTIPLLWIVDEDTTIATEATIVLVRSIVRLLSAHGMKNMDIGAVLDILMPRILPMCLQTNMSDKLKYQLAIEITNFFKIYMNLSHITGVTSLTKDAGVWMETCSRTFMFAFENSTINILSNDTQNMFLTKYLELQSLNEPTHGNVPSCYTYMGAPLNQADFEKTKNTFSFEYVAAITFLDILYVSTKLRVPDMERIRKEVAAPDRRAKRMKLSSGNSQSIVDMMFKFVEEMPQVTFRIFCIIISMVEKRNSSFENVPILRKLFELFTDYLDNQKFPYSTSFLMANVLPNLSYMFPNSRRILSSLDKGTEFMMNIKSLPDEENEQLNIAGFLQLTGSVAISTWVANDSHTHINFVNRAIKLVMNPTIFLTLENESSQVIHFELLLSVFYFLNSIKSRQRIFEDSVSLTLKNMRVLLGLFLRISTNDTSYKGSNIMLAVQYISNIYGFHMRFRHEIVDFAKYSTAPPRIRQESGNLSKTIDGLDDNNINVQKMLCAIYENRNVHFNPILYDSFFNPRLYSDRNMMVYPNNELTKLIEYDHHETHRLLEMISDKFLPKIKDSHNFGSLLLLIMTLYNATVHDPDANELSIMSKIMDAYLTSAIYDISNFSTLNLILSQFICATNKCVTLVCDIDDAGGILKTIYEKFEAKYLGSTRRQDVEEEQIIWIRVLCSLTYFSGLEAPETIIKSVRENKNCLTYIAKLPTDERISKYIPVESYSYALTKNDRFIKEAFFSAMDNLLSKIILTSSNYETINVALLERILFLVNELNPNTFSRISQGTPYKKITDFLTKNDEVGKQARQSLLSTNDKLTVSILIFLLRNPLPNIDVLDALRTVIQLNDPLSVSQIFQNARLVSLLVKRHPVYYLTTDLWENLSIELYPAFRDLTLQLMVSDPNNAHRYYAEAFVTFASSGGMEQHKSFEMIFSYFRRYFGIDNRETFRLTFLQSMLKSSSNFAKIFFDHKKDLLMGRNFGSSTWNHENDVIWVPYVIRGMISSLEYFKDISQQECHLIISLFDALQDDATKTNDITNLNIALASVRPLLDHCESRGTEPMPMARELSNNLHQIPSRLILESDYVPLYMEEYVCTMVNMGLKNSTILSIVMDITDGSLLQFQRKLTSSIVPVLLRQFYVLRNKSYFNKYAQAILRIHVGLLTYTDSLGKTVIQDEIRNGKFNSTFEWDCFFVILGKYATTPGNFHAILRSLVTIYCQGSVSPSATKRRIIVTVLSILHTIRTNKNLSHSCKGMVKSLWTALLGLDRLAFLLYLVPSYRSFVEAHDLMYFVSEVTNDVSNYCKQMVDHDAYLIELTPKLINDMAAECITLMKEETCLPIIAKPILFRFVEYYCSMILLNRDVQLSGIEIAKKTPLLDVPVTHFWNLKEATLSHIKHMATYPKAIQKELVSPLTLVALVSESFHDSNADSVSNSIMDACIDPANMCKKVHMCLWSDEADVSTNALRAISLICSRNYLEDISSNMPNYTKKAFYVSKMLQVPDTWMLEKEISLLQPSLSTSFDTNGLLIDMDWESLRDFICLCITTYSKDNLDFILMPMIATDDDICATMAPRIAKMALSSFNPSNLDAAYEVRSHLSYVVNSILANPEFPNDIVTVILQIIIALKYCNLYPTTYKKALLPYNCLWFDLNPEHVLNAAIRTNEYHHALYFLETCIDQQQSYWKKVPEPFIITPYKENPIPVLMKIFKQSKDTDGYDGAISLKRNIDISEATSLLLDKHVLANNWDKVYNMAENPRTLNGNLNDSSLAMAHALNNLGYNHQLKGILVTSGFKDLMDTTSSGDSLDTEGKPNTEELQTLVDLQYASAWKNLTWDLPATNTLADKKEIPSESSTFGKILDVMSNMDSKIVYKRTFHESVFEYLLDTSSGNFEEVKNSIINDAISAIKSGNINRFKTSVINGFSSSKVAEIYKRLAIDGIFNVALNNQYALQPIVSCMDNVQYFYDQFDTSLISTVRDKVITALMYDSYHHKEKGLCSFHILELQQMSVSAMLQHYRECNLNGMTHIAHNVLVDTNINEATMISKKLVPQLALKYLGLLDSMWKRGDQSTAVKLIENFISSKGGNTFNAAKNGHVILSNDIMSQFMKKTISWLSVEKSISASAIQSKIKGYQYIVDTCKDVSTKAETYLEFAKFSEGEYKMLVEEDPTTQLTENMIFINERIAEGERLHASGATTEKVYLSWKKTYEKHLRADQESLAKYKKDRNTYLLSAMSHYVAALSYGGGTSDIEAAVFKLYSLWADNKASKGGNEVMRKFVQGNNFPTKLFLGLLYQLSARMDIKMYSTLEFQSILVELVTKICIDFPYHSLYQIVALKNSGIVTDSTTNSRAGNRTAEDVISRLRRVPLLREIVDQIVNLCDAYIDLAYMSSKQKIIKREMKIRRLTFDKVHVTTAHLNVLLPTRNSVGNVTKYPSITAISGFSPTYVDPGGITGPKKIVCIGSDGRQYLQLVKKSDDLRQDAVIMSIFNKVSSLLNNTAATKRRRMNIRTYKVIPMAPRSGIVEWVENTAVISTYLKHAHELYNRSDWKTSKCREEMDRVLGERGSAELKIEMYNTITSNFHPIMRQFFFESFKSPEEWFYKRIAYTRSVAASSIAGYMVGLGDRHAGNILIDLNTAEVIHIDLGIAFDQGKQLNIPERVPFRLTRDIVDGMGYLGIEGHFKRFCEETLNVLRFNSETIMTILDVFRFDPLYSWKLSPAQMIKKQMTEKSTPEDDAFNMEEENDRSAGDDEGGNKNAVRALFVVRQKLSASTSCECKVNELIMEATDTRNLALLFPGWTPWM